MTSPHDEARMKLRKDLLVAAKILNNLPHDHH
jgi:hypothetical protein